MTGEERSRSALRRALAAAVVTGVVAATGAMLPPAQAVPAGRVVDGHIGDWQAVSSMVAGTVVYGEGELVYQDHVYDDSGAAVLGQRPPQHGTFEGRSTGTYRYPTDADRYADNVADLLELRLATSGDHVYGLVRLNAYRDPTTTVAALALDLDGATDDLSGRWPHDAAVSTPGADVVITVWGTGGDLVDLDTGVTVPVEVAASTDDADNAIEFRVDRRHLPGTSWSVWAATGLWDGATSWLAVPSGAPTATTPGHGDPALPRAFNVAFRASETGSFGEDQQAAALAAGDLSAFVRRVDVGALDRGLDRPHRFQPGDSATVIVDQGFTIGPLHEGQSYDGVPGRFSGAGGAALDQHFDYFGRHQPYLLALPDDWSPERTMPVALVLHGLGGTHAGFQTRVSFRDQVLEAPGHDSLIMVSPLGRGSSFYADYGERDVMEQLADAESRFRIDPDRRYLIGYSMGGYGVYRLATAHPDLWAAAAVFAGYTGEFLGVAGEDGRGKCACGDPVDVMGNLGEVPVLHAAPSNDEIVPTAGQVRMHTRLEELGLRHRFDLYPGYEHLSFALLDDWAGARDWLGARTRSTAPRRISYRFTPGFNDPALDVDLGLRYDSAYWISGLRRRSAAATPAMEVFTYGQVDAESFAVPGTEPVVSPILEPAVGNMAHVRTGVEWGDGPALPTANRLALDLRDVAEASVDLARAGLDEVGLHVVLTTDGPARVLLAGNFSGLRVTGTGVSVGVTDDGVVVEAAEAGTFDVRAVRPGGGNRD